MCSMVEKLCKEAAAEAEAKAARAKEEAAIETEKSLRELGVAEDIISMTLSRILKPQTA